MTSVTLEAIMAARQTIASVTRLTPIWPSETLSALCGVDVTLKCEQMQRTGSFKLRGATNFVAALSAQERQQGLVAASAGNHAQGIAYAAQQAGVAVTVVMPETAPLTKITSTRGYGAQAILHGESLAEAHERALEISREEGLIWVPPFDNDRIICGQGTVGLEILEQAPDVEEILVPTGGGGLLAGIATAVKSQRPGVRIIGVQTEAMSGVVQSLARHTLVTTGPRPTIADGVAVAGPSARTLALIEQHVDEMVTVSESAIAHAVLMLVERARMVVEGAGALGVAALQSGAYRPRGTTVAVLSGGNIDINLLGAIVRQGLVEAGRYQRLSVCITDQPGTLAAITAIVAAQEGNVLEVDHDREAPGMPLGKVMLDLLIEVDGEQHFATIRKALAVAGFDTITTEQQE